MLFKKDTSVTFQEVCIPVRSTAAVQASSAYHRSSAGSVARGGVQHSAGSAIQGGVRLLARKGKQIAGLPRAEELAPPVCLVRDRQPEKITVLFFGFCFVIKCGLQRLNSECGFVTCFRRDCWDPAPKQNTFRI